MPGAIGLVDIKDGNGTLIVGKVRMFDVSGTGVGPWVPVSQLYDPVSGALGTIKPTSTAPVTATDTALVTVLRPDSAGIIPTGTPGSPNTTNVLSVQGEASMTPLAVGGVTTVPSTTLTRPATTPTYASGQLFANSATAGSVTNLSWSTAARISGGSGTIIGAQIQKNGNTVTGAAFRVHLFTVAPTYVTAGDTSPLTTVVVASAKGYLGYVDITTMVGFSDVAWGSGAPDNTRGGIPFVAVAQTLFGLVETRGAYVGVSGEILTVFLDILQD